MWQCALSMEHTPTWSCQNWLSLLWRWEMLECALIPTWSLLPVILPSWHPPAAVVVDASGCDGCIRLTVGSGEAGNNPTGKGWLGQCAPLTTVLVNVFTNLGEMNTCSQYENMRQPSYPMNSGQPRACSRMHAQISPWHGCLSRLPLKLPPYHIRYSANRMGISALKLWNLS